MPKVSLIMPAYNEAENLKQLLPLLKMDFPDAELIVVDDGSSDNTSEVCRDHGIRVVQHPYNKGNGASLKSGARAAKGDILVFMDSDGQHTPDMINGLLEKLDDNMDMVVGARSSDSQASFLRLAANKAYNFLASRIVGHEILDLTSGFRAVRAKKYRQFLHLLPNRFSAPSTITMAFFRMGYSVGYYPIVARPRGGSSHIQPLTDPIRFLVIIYKVATLYSPLKVFFPLAGISFLFGVFRDIYSIMSVGELSSTGGLFIGISFLILLFALVSEQITVLTYQTQPTPHEDPD